MSSDFIVLLLSQDSLSFKQIFIDNTDTNSDLFMLTDAQAKQIATSDVLTISNFKLVYGDDYEDMGTLTMTKDKIKFVSAKSGYTFDRRWLFYSGDKYDYFNKIISKNNNKYSYVYPFFVLKQKDHKKPIFFIKDNKIRIFHFELSDILKIHEKKQFKIFIVDVIFDSVMCNLSIVFDNYFDAHIDVNITIFKKQSTELLTNIKCVMREFSDE